MSPLAQNTTIAADPTPELTSNRPTPAIALASGAPEAIAPAVPAASAILDATLILSAFSPGTRRQLELTVNALSRTFRRAIRHAERLERDNAPIEEQDAAWERVEHRSALLQDFLKSLALPAAVPAPEPAPAPVVLTAAPAPTRPLVPATNQKVPQMAPETLPPILATPSITLDSGEAALFTECITEFRRVRAMPTTCRAERRRQERAGHNLITKVNRQGDAFANRVYEAMKKIDADESIEHQHLRPA